MKLTAAVAAALLLLTAVAGCDSHTAPVEAAGSAGIVVFSGTTSTTLPRGARPHELRLDGKDPCGTVPQADWATFAINRAVPGQDPTFRSPSCFFNSSRASMGVVLVVTEGIGVWAPGARPAQPTPVAPVRGYPAISLVRAENTTACDIAIDVAPGQYVLAGVIVDLNDLAALPDRCVYAHQFADVVLRTLLG